MISSPAVRPRILRPCRGQRDSLLCAESNRDSPRGRCSAVQDSGDLLRPPRICRRRPSPRRIVPSWNRSPVGWPVQSRSRMPPERQRQVMSGRSFSSVSSSFLFRTFRNYSTKHQHFAARIGCVLPSTNHGRNRRGSILTDLPEFLLKIPHRQVVINTEFNHVKTGLRGLLQVIQRLPHQDLCTSVLGEAEDA